MSKKRRDAPTHPARPVAGPTAGPARAPRLTGGRKWAARGALVVLAPLLLLTVLELGLRVVGYGYSTKFFAKMEDGRSFTTNRRFGWQFMQRDSTTQPWPVNLPVEKAPGTSRIFILGESAALGTPAPQFGFGRILELMLRQQYPERRFEVINAAMRGINSHAVRPIARECAGHEPDLFLVYMGNNEVVGLYAPDPGEFNLTTHRRLIRVVQWFKATRLAQLLGDAGRRLSRAPARREKQDMEYFRKHRLAADDPVRLAMRENFRANLAAVVRAGRGAGAKVVVSTVGANLLDFPPLGSLHRADLAATDLARWETAFREGTAAEAAGQHDQAVGHYLTAAGVDNHFAELSYRLARCYLAKGDLEKAREFFTRARDWDALQFRTDGRFNQAIREFATTASDPGVIFTDAEQALADAAGETRLPGNRFFHEHVHLTFEGDYVLARAFLPIVTKALGLGGGPASSALPTQSECAEALGFTAWDAIGTRTAIVRMLGNPPFLDQVDHGRRQAAAEGAIADRTRAFSPEAMEQAKSVDRAALARRADDWQIRYSFGNLLADFGEHAAAAAEFAMVVKVHPEFLPARVALGRTLWQAGQSAEARAQFDAILRLEPNYLPAKAVLAELSAAGRTRP